MFPGIVDWNYFKMLLGYYIFHKSHPPNLEKKPPPFALWPPYTCIQDRFTGAKVTAENNVDLNTR